MGPQKCEDSRLNHRKIGETLPQICCNAAWESLFLYPIMSVTNIAIVQRTRKSPFYDATIRAGAKGFTVYNHMMMPTWYEGPEVEYHHLMSNVTLWDVAVERQVEIKGKDAFHLVRLMTPRNLAKARVGRCYYVPIVDENGGIINDPLLLRLAEDQFWLSLADSDVLLYAKGLAIGHGLDVEICEPDVSPLAIQGPNSDVVAAAVFGDEVTKLKFFGFIEMEVEGIPVVVAKSGWSKQGGYEIYLRDGQYGEKLWNMIWAAGEAHGIKPATPNSIERIETGLLSYGSDMTLENNPFEVGLGQYCDVDQEFEFIGRSALKKIRDEGITQKLVGLLIDGEKIGWNSAWWPVTREGQPCGKVTSAIYSLALNKNIAFAILPIDSTELGTKVTVHSEYGDREATVVKLPFVS